MEKSVEAITEVNAKAVNKAGAIFEVMSYIFILNLLSLVG
jgi:hypothetical protein